MPIVGTLIFGSPDCQVVGILIVSFPEHELRNANLQKGHFDGSGPTASPMIKLAKNIEREKSSGGVGSDTFPSRGSFRLIGFGYQNPLIPSRDKILSPPSLREEIFFPYR